jgi:hypothetical protein
MVARTALATLSADEGAAVVKVIEKIADQLK